MNGATLRTNGEIFLRALQSGIPVEFRGTKWQLIKAGEDIVCPSGNYAVEWDVLVSLGTMSRGDESWPVMIPSDIPYNDLMRMCHNMTEMERMGIIASQVLMAENQRK